MYKPNRTVRTKGGMRVQIVHVLETPASNGDAVIGVYYGADGETEIMTWQSNGRFDARRSGTLDLVPEQEASPLDLAWEKINALGGYVAPNDSEGSGFVYGIEKALAVIEELGGSDQLKRKAAA